MQFLPYKMCNFFTTNWSYAIVENSNPGDFGSWNTGTPSLSVPLPTPIHVQKRTNDWNLYFPSLRPVSTSANSAARPSDWAIRACAAQNPSWKRAFTGEGAVSSGSWIKFNFFATWMSENQSDCFFSMLEYAIVPVRATKFAEVETGL